MRAWRLRAPLGQTLSVAMLVLLGTSLGGCILEIPSPSMDLSRGLDRLPVDETGPWTNHDPTEKELLLARSDFSVEIVRFSDARRARSMESLSGDQLIYQYDPDALLGGVSYEIPGVLGKYLSYRPKTPKHYKVEIDLKKLVTVIKDGTFWSGSWGRYSVQFELNVTARRPDSTVVLHKTYYLKDEQRREDYNGRGPSKERDRSRMYDLTESLLRKAAENIGWDIRQYDARTWKPEAPQTIPTRLNLPALPPQASGTPENDVAPLQPVPLIVPAVQRDVTPAPVQPVDEAPVTQPKATGGWIEAPVTKDDSGSADGTDNTIKGTDANQPDADDTAVPGDENNMGPVI